MLGENRTTSRTMLAFGEACACASGSCCRVDNFGVSCGGNNGLLGENRTTSRTMLALGEACACASGSYRAVCNLQVRNNVYNHLCCEYFSTLFALCAVGEACRGAGCRVALECFGFSVGAFCVADEAALIAGFVIFIVVGMRNQGCGLLCNGYSTAGRAMLALCETCARASRGYRLIYNLCVSLEGCCLLSDQNCITDRALLAFGETCTCAGGFNAGDNLLNVCLEGRGFLGNQYLAAIRALYALGQAVFGAGGFFCRDDLEISVLTTGLFFYISTACAFAVYVGVTVGRNSVALLLAAVAISSFHAVFGAGGVFCDRPFGEFMCMSATGGEAGQKRRGQR